MAYQGATQKVSIPLFYVTPLYPVYQKRLVHLGANLVMSKGTVLGEYSAQVGVYGPYDRSAMDGRQLARCILECDCATDENGIITLASLVKNQGPLALQLRQVIYAYIKAFFATEDLVGLDANALGQLGRLVSGTVQHGVLTMS